jgi:DnaJ-class molecular chaperone
VKKLVLFYENTKRGGYRMSFNLDDEDGYIYVRKETMVKTKIPEGNVKCPTCKGCGEVRRYWGQPWDKGQFIFCITCNGKGFLPKEDLESLRKSGLIK